MSPDKVGKSFAANRVVSDTEQDKNVDTNS